jgi:hypothetical protein
MIMGQQHDFTIQAVDGNGNKCSVGGDQICAYLRSGKAEMAVETDDLADGTYALRCTAKQVGTHFLFVDVNGSALASSPFEMQVLAGSADASTSRLSVLDTHTMVAGELVRLVLEARDKHGNKRAVGGDDVTFEVDGMSELRMQTTDSGNGTYLLSFVSSKACTHSIRASINGQVLPDAVEVDVQPASTHAAHCSAEGEAVNRAVAGQTSKFVVRTTDHLGNKRQSGGDLVKAELHGASMISATVVDRADGTYEVEYCCTKSGEYALVVTVGSAPILGSPFAVSVVPDEVDARCCSLAGKGLMSAVAGSTAQLCLNLHDRYYNAVNHGTEQVSIELHAKQPGMEPTTGRTVATKQQQTSCLLEYTVEHAGVHKLSVMVNGVNVANSPFDVMIEPAEACADKCRAAGDALHSAIAGESARFSVDVFDRFGSRRMAGSDVVDAQLSGPTSAIPRVVEGADG